MSFAAAFKLSPVCGSWYDRAADSCNNPFGVPCPVLPLVCIFHSPQTFPSNVNHRVYGQHYKKLRWKVAWLYFCIFSKKTNSIKKQYKMISLMEGRLYFREWLFVRNLNVAAGMCGGWMEKKITLQSNFLTDFSFLRGLLTWCKWHYSAVSY